VERAVLGAVTGDCERGGRGSGRAARAARRLTEEEGRERRKREEEKEEEEKKEEGRKGDVRRHILNGASKHDDAPSAAEPIPISSLSLTSVLSRMR